MSSRNSHSSKCLEQNRPCKSDEPLRPFPSLSSQCSRGWFILLSHVDQRGTPSCVLRVPPYPPTSLLILHLLPGSVSPSDMSAELSVSFSGPRSPWGCVYRPAPHYSQLPRGRASSAQLHLLVSMSATCKCLWDPSCASQSLGRYLKTPVPTPRDPDLPDLRCGPWQSEKLPGCF